MAFTPPGTNFEIHGRRYAQSISGPNSERLIIFAMAQDGPVYEPMHIDNVADARSVFGPASYVNGYLDPNTGSSTGQNAGATLPLAIEKARAGGCSDIWVCRIGGTYAVSPSGFGGKLNVRAKYPGRLYNQVSLTTTTTGSVLGIVLSQPAIKGGVRSFTMAATSTVSELIDAINNWQYNKTVNINRDSFPSILNSAAYTALGSGYLILGATSGVGSSVGATSGTNGCRAPGEDYGPANGVSGLVAKILEVDTGAFDKIEGLNFPFDVATIDGVYFDDQVVVAGQTRIGSSDTYTSAEEYSTTLGNEFQIWLERVSSKINPCVGVMGVRPCNLRDDVDFISYINNNLLATSYGFYNSALKWTKAGAFMYNGFRRYNFVGESDVFDGGARLMVVAGPEAVMYHKDIGNYVDMWHVQYAAMLTTIPPERAPILKPVAGIEAYGMAIPRRYAEKLIAGVGWDPANNLSGRAAYVCAVKDPSNYLGPQVIFSDCTAAWREDYFSQWQLVHLCNRLESDLADVLRPFLGGPTDAYALGAMKTKIKNVLDSYASSGAFRGFEGQGYTYDVTMDGVDALLGLVTVFLEINPATALRSIRLTVNVRNAAS